MLNDLQKYAIKETISIDFKDEIFHTSDSFEKEVTKIIEALNTHTENYEGDYEILNRVFYDHTLFYNLEQNNVDPITVGEIKSYILEFIYTDLKQLSANFNFNFDEKFVLNQLTHDHVEPFNNIPFNSKPLTNQEIANMHIQMDIEELNEEQIIGMEMGLTRNQVLSNHFGGYDTVLEINQIQINSNKSASEIFTELYETEPKIKQEEKDFIDFAKPADLNEFAYYYQLGFSEEQLKNIVDSLGGTEQIDYMIQTLGMDINDICTSLLGE